MNQNSERGRGSVHSCTRWHSSDTAGQCHSHSTAASLLLLFAVAPGGKSSVESNTEEAGNKNAGPAPKTIFNFPVTAAFQGILNFFSMPEQTNG